MLILYVVEIREYPKIFTIQLEKKMRNNTETVEFTTLDISENCNTNNLVIVFSCKLDRFNLKLLD